MASSQQEARDRMPFGILARPADTLSDLPIRLRWEVTRRHPYYQLFWKETARYLRGDSGGDPLARVGDLCAYGILASIGVTGVPPDPALAFGELGAAADDPAFLTGTLQPQTFRTTALMLLANLPPGERALLGSLMTASAYADTGRDDPAIATTSEDATRILLKHESAAFDSYPVAPLFSIHVGASQNAFLADAKRQFKIWSAKRGVRAAKVQLAKVEGYLRIWDLREGWTGGGYERGRERRIREIAGELKKPLSTVLTGYKAAFGYIAGHDYQPEIWFQLFALLKYSRYFGFGASGDRRGVARWMQSQSDKPIPSSVLTRKGDDSMQSFVEHAATVSDDFGMTELKSFILDLAERESTPEQIAEALGWKEYGLNGVNFVRETVEGRTGI